MTDRTTPDARPLRAGDPARLGAYEILGRLGEGGQGSVYLGRPAGGMAPGDGFVAIKLLHAGLTSDPNARGRFVRELEVAKRVARFCTAQILDADVEGDQPYIVSEYVPGRSLFRQVMEEGPRTGGALERLAISTLTALTAIHRAGIVHRDFKPHNVMLGPDGPRVIDFGVARALGAAGETQNVGTPAYMSPEQFRGEPIGPPTDMFAWGTTMVFAATGRPAFGNDDLAAVMHRILTGEPDLGNLSEPLRGVVTACLSKDPARRPTARQAQELLVGSNNAAPYDIPGALQAPPQPIDPDAGDTPRIPSPPHAPEGNTPASPAGSPGASSDTPPFASPPYAPSPAPERNTPAPPGGAPGMGGDTPPFASAATVPPYASAAGGNPPPSAYAPVTGAAGAPPQSGRQRGRLVPAVAAAAVTALVVGVSVWAATRSGGDGAAASGTDVVANGPGTTQSGDPNAPGGPGSAAPGKRRSPSTSGKPTGSAKPKNGTPSPTGRPSGGTGGGGATQPERPNPYSPQQVCNSGGHGGGYYVQRSSSFPGGTVYQLYNGSGYNCAVTIKTRNVGKATKVWTRIEAQNGGGDSDSGSFQYYAGPVYVSAKGVCVRYSGGTSTGSAGAPWGNCG
ncbi:serine/threonine protein kinase [Thermomonospora cellulosilytica]|uniref:Serine/threonine protein kinase n=1 Tax=Thermomonospora cellulosilytica TaxID=1411118 RepID=A0A7W3R8L4_9ACTN|nr:protein kinase [Thermomonospora cellulosilytica]MBA9003435.1 serine/threonine protein kinase [Thermomonospora cellulosilytica]